MLWKLSNFILAPTLIGSHYWSHFIDMETNDWKVKQFIGGHWGMNGSVLLCCLPFGKKITPNGCQNHSSAITSISQKGV